MEEKTYEVLLGLGIIASCIGAGMAWGGYGVLFAGGLSCMAVAIIKGEK